MKQTRVIIVNDSVFVRETLQAYLERDINITVVAKTNDPYIACDMIAEHRPDVLITGMEINRMRGDVFVKKLLPQYFIPVIMISSAVSDSELVTDIQKASFLLCPDMQDTYEADVFCRDAAIRIKSIISGTSSLFDAEQIYSKIIVIGASTGGNNALEALLSKLPPVMPPIVIAQHMPPRFTKSFADRLNDQIPLSIKEASHGEMLVPGQVYIAPGGHHTTIKLKNGCYYINITENIEGTKTCPNITRLFNSAASAGKNATGVILTGMGNDGAEGLLEMRKAGARTIGQDKDTSVVYGMPKAAFDTGAVEIQLPLELIAAQIIKLQ